MASETAPVEARRLPLPEPHDSGDGLMGDRDEQGRFLAGHGFPGPGRPSEYDPSRNEQAPKLALLRLTDAEIAEFFGVCEDTLNNWKRAFPAFLASLNAGKIAADADVADSL